MSEREWGTVSLGGDRGDTGRPSNAAGTSRWVELDTPLLCWHESRHAARTDPVVALSRTSLVLKTDRHLPVGVAVFLELTADSGDASSRVLEIDAVVDAEPHPGGTALRFVQVNAELRRVLDTHLRPERVSPPEEARTPARPASPVSFHRGAVDEETRPWVTLPVVSSAERPSVEHVAQPLSSGGRALNQTDEQPDPGPAFAPAAAPAAPSAVALASSTPKAVDVDFDTGDVEPSVDAHVVDRDRDANIDPGAAADARAFDAHTEPLADVALTTVSGPATPPWAPDHAEHTAPWSEAPHPVSRPDAHAAAAKDAQAVFETAPALSLADMMQTPPASDVSAEAMRETGEPPVPRVETPAFLNVPNLERRSTHNPFAMRADDGTGPSVDRTERWSIAAFSGARDPASPTPTVSATRSTPSLSEAEDNFDALFGVSVDVDEEPPVKPTRSMFDAPAEVSTTPRLSRNDPAQTARSSAPHFDDDILDATDPFLRVRSAETEHDLTDAQSADHRRSSSLSGAATIDQQGFAADSAESKLPFVTATAPPPATFDDDAEPEVTANMPLGLQRELVMRALPSDEVLVEPSPPEPASVEPSLVEPSVVVQPSLDEPWVQKPLSDPLLLDRRPLDTRPLDARPLDARPLDARPLDARPLDARPLDARPLDARPLDALPLDALPRDTLPVETLPPVPSASAASPADASAVRQSGSLPINPDAAPRSTDPLFPALALKPLPPPPAPMIVPRVQTPRPVRTEPAFAAATVQNLAAQPFSAQPLAGQLPGQPLPAQAPSTPPTARQPAPAGAAPAASHLGPPPLPWMRARSELSSAAVNNAVNDVLKQTARAAAADAPLLGQVLHAGLGAPSARGLNDPFGPEGETPNTAPTRGAQDVGGELDALFTAQAFDLVFEGVPDQSRAQAFEPQAWSVDEHRAGPPNTAALDDPLPVVMGAADPMTLLDVTLSGPNDIDLPVVVGASRNATPALDTLKLTDEDWFVPPPQKE